MSMLTVGGPMPVSIGRCADLYHDVREMRLAMEKEVAALQARETEIHEHILANLSKSDDTGAAGLRYRAQVVVKPKVRLLADQWGGFTSWMNKNNRFDMIQRRLNDKAALDYVAETGQVLPYWERLQIPSLSVTKIG
jgi:hypothetical protein